METLHLDLPSPQDDTLLARVLLHGVVSSGNLEVLVEPGSDAARCVFEVQTAAHGFAEVWQAVLTDFTARHPVGGLVFSIHDAGATPAVVSLRLDQAYQSLRGS
jgi:malonate decarboxylase delta subunit